MLMGEVLCLGPVRVIVSILDLLPARQLHVPGLLAGRFVVGSGFRLGEGSGSERELLGGEAPLRLACKANGGRVVGNMAPLGWACGASGGSMAPRGWDCGAGGGRLAGSMAPRAWACQSSGGRVTGSVAPGCEVESGKVPGCREP